MPDGRIFISGGRISLDSHQEIDPDDRLIAQSYRYDVLPSELGYSHGLIRSESVLFFANNYRSYNMNHG